MASDYDVRRAGSTERLDELHHEADHRTAIRHLARQFLDEREMSQCTFTPRVNRRSLEMIDPAEYKPIYGVCVVVIYC